MNKLLLIIDLQKSFINYNTENIPKAIEELLNTFKTKPLIQKICNVSVLQMVDRFD